MIDRATKLRLRRKYRSRRKQVETIGERAEQHFDKHIFRRLNNLPGVRRFIFSWLALLFLLASGVVVQTRALGRYYQVNGPAAGGIYTEGVLGVFTNANPIYATTTVDSSVSRLLFSSLFNYNAQGQLVGDIAEKLDVDETGRKYTVTLRKDLTWHDGRRLTSEDVIFTYSLIQNPDAKSPLNGSWQGITIEAPDEYTVIFTLPNRLSSFPYSMTNGIVPKHQLALIPLSQLRSAPFNTINPVGSGPYKWDSVQVTGGDAETRTQQIVMQPFEAYYAGEPKLSRFVIKTFRSEDQLAKSFEDQELTAAVGLSGLSQELNNDSTVSQYDLSLSSAVMVFFKMTDPILSDIRVREALTYGTNRPLVLRELGYPVIAVDGPLLRGQIGYNSAIKQLPFNLAEANKLLDEAGWQMNTNGVRQKDGRDLEIVVTSQDTPEYSKVMSKLQQQWQSIGVQLKENMVTETEIQSTMIPLHSYQALLYGISIGPDPDVFAYWHSTQIDITSQGRLNLSEYKSAVVDEALEGGRTREDPILRTAKYRPLLETWRVDAPAIGLYQPRILYVTRGSLYNFVAKKAHSGTDRYINAHNWMIKQEKILK